MPDHKPYTDPILGTATWDDARNCWNFAVVLPSGGSVEAGIWP